MKLDQEYSSQDLNNATKYALNNRITQQIVIDINNLNKIESLVDKNLIQIEEDNKSIIIELNKEKIKKIEESLDKNNIKYKNFACLENKKAEFVSKATGSLYIAASQLVLEEHHSLYYKKELSSVQNKEKRISLEEFKNKKSMELPNKITKNILTKEDFLKAISQPDISADDIVRMALELSTKMKQPKNNIKNTLKPKPEFIQDKDKK